MTAAAVIVAAGKGERFGDSGKVLAKLLDRPVLTYSLDAFEQANSISEIVVVVGPHTKDPIAQLLNSGAWSKVSCTVAGGDTRQQSTAYGVAAVSADVDVILVHDAARPLIQVAQIDTCVQVTTEHGGAIVAAPVTDTIKRVTDGLIDETVDRSTLWAAQTPQGFRADLLRAMVDYSETTTDAVTDEASLAEALGYPVRIVPGDSTNIKITHPADILVAETLLRTRKEQDA